MHRPGYLFQQAHDAGPAVTAAVQCPWAGSRISDRIAPTGDEAFFVSCVRTSGSRVHAVLTGSRIYRFQVTSTGAIAGYSLVPGGTLPGLSVAGLTAAAPASWARVQLWPAGFPGCTRPAGQSGAGVTAEPDQRGMRPGRLALVRW